MKSFLAGLGLGIGLGVLFAPTSGEETRRNITDRANDLADQAREVGDQVRERVRTGMSAIRGGAATGTENPVGNVGVSLLSIVPFGMRRGAAGPRLYRTSLRYPVAEGREQVTALLHRRYPICTPAGTHGVIPR